MAVMDRGGVRLAYSEEGSGDPALVLIHGWTCDRSYFSAQREYFRSRQRVVSVDLRGHGESDKPQGDYPVGRFAEDVVWLLAELGIDRPIVVGHSMGGLVALEIAAEHPSSVGAIVMLDPAPFTKPAPLRAAMQNVIDSIEAGNPQPRQNFIASMFLPTSPADLKRRISSEMASAPPHVAAAVMRGVLEYDAVAAAAKVRVPVLHIAGTPPRNPPHLVAEWLPSVVTGWTVGAGHFNMLEAPLQVNSMIESFVEHHVQRSQAAGVRSQ